MKKKVFAVISIVAFIFVSCLLTAYAVDDEYGGSTAPDSKLQYYIAGQGTSDVTFQAKQNGFTYTGHHFTKWADGDQPTTKYAVGKSITFSPKVNESSTKIVYAEWDANTYTIKYYQGNNAASEGATVLKQNGSDITTTATYGENVTLAKYTGTAPTGWTFAGWTTDKNGTTAVFADEANNVKNLTPTNNGTVNLYAVFQRTINVYSGLKHVTNKPKTQYYNPNKQSNVSQIELEVPANITNWNKLGYRTDTTAGAATTAVTTANVKVTPAYSQKAPIYYAVYSRSYTAHFYSGKNNATDKTKASNAAYYNTYANNTLETVAVVTDTAANSTDISGWTEEGWRDDTNADASEYAYAATANVPFGTNFYSIYSRDLSMAYNGNGETGGSTASHTLKQYYTSNGTTSSVTFKTATNGFTKTGYSFSKWANDSASGAQVAAGENAAAFNPGIDKTTAAQLTKTMYAIWTANTYTITLNNQEATTAGTSSVQATFDSNLSNITVPTKKGYTFGGYYTNANAIDMTTSVSNLSTTSKRINFNQGANGWAMTTAGDKGTHIQGKIIVTDSSLTTAPTLDCNDISITPYKIEHSGNVWTLYVDLDLTEQMVSKRGGTPFDTTYRFIDVNGITASSTVTVDYLTKGGKKYYNNSGTGTYISDFTSNTTLYAKWTPNTYHVTYKANGGTGNDVTQDIVYGEKFTVKGYNTFSRAGYTSIGWNTSATATTASWTTANSTNWTWTYDYNVTLYAIWQSNTVTVNINKDGSAWSASGMKVTLYNGTTATSYTATVSGSGVSKATFTAVPNGTYNIYIGKDSNHKTDLIDSNVDVKVNNNSPTATVNYYTLTMQTENATATVNGTAVANNATVVLAGGTTTTANNYAHAIVGTGASGYHFGSWSAVDGSPTIASASAASTTVKVGAASKIKVAGAANTVKVNIYKDGAAWSNSGMKVTLYNGTTATSYTATVSSGSAATISAVPNGTYNIYAGKDSSNKTTLLDSGVDVTVNNNNPTAVTINYYSLTLATGTGISDVSNGGTSTTSAKQYLYNATAADRQTIAIDATVSAGYTWSTWTKTSGTNLATFTAGTKSQNIKMGAGAVTLTASATPNTYTITYDYRNTALTTFNQTNEYEDTGYLIDWSKNFTITGSFRPITAARRYLVIGNYLDGVQTLNIEVNTDNKFRIYMGNGTVDAVSSTTIGTFNKELTYTFTWTASTKAYTFTATETDTNVSMNGTYSAATGTATKTLRTGKTDYRDNGSSTFNASSYARNLKITKEYTYGGKLSNPTPVTRVGYTWNGWYTATSGGTQVTNDTAIPAANTTYYGRWTGYSYSIKFNKNADDATGTMANEAMVFGTAKALTENAFTRTGYTFMGWNTAANGTGTVYTDKQSINNATKTQNGIFNLYAIWRKNGYTVQFNGNGNTSGTTANQNVNYSTATALTQNGFAKTGYSFKNWTDGVNTYANKANVNINMNLLNNTSSMASIGGGSWSAGTWRTASVGGGSRTVIDVTDGPSSLITKGFQIVGNGSSLEIAQDNVPVTIGQKYTLSLYAKGTGTLRIGVGNSPYKVQTTAMSNVTTWTRYTMTFTAGSDSAASANNKTNIYFGNGAASGTIQICGVKLEAGETATPYIDSTDTYPLKANWTANTYTISYNLDGGALASGKTNPTSATYDATVTIENHPTKTGYTFAGWTATSGLTTATAKYGTSSSAITTAWSNANTKVTAKYFKNLTSTSGGTVALKANWTANTYTISYDYASGTAGAKAPTSGTYNSNVEISNPTRTGYTFAGWKSSTTDGLQGNAVSCSTSNGTFAAWNGTTATKNTFFKNLRNGSGTVKLTATWTANTYTIKFNNNTGTGTMADESMTYDVEKALTTNTFTKTGYTFAGWSTSASDTAKINDSGEYTGTKASGESGYSDFKQYTVAGPFASGDVYQLEVDVKGSGRLINYFYGETNYLRVASWSSSDGRTGTNTDGANDVPLTSSYTHYTVRFTLGSSGTGTVNKRVLFRAMPGCTATIKNVRFFKVTSNSTAYADGQTVKNLTATNGGTVNLYAIWTVNQYTITFAPNGGTMNSATSATTYTQDYGTTITMNNPTRTGYEFMGWVSDKRTNVTTAGYWTYTDSKDPLTGNTLEILNAENHRLNGYAGGKPYTATPTTVSGSYAAGKATATTSTVNYTTADPNPLKGISATSFYRLTRTSATDNSYSNGPLLNLNYLHRDVNQVYVIVARFPVGWSIQEAANSGSSTFKWLTSQAGTGTWQTYVFARTADENNRYMNSGHFYIRNTNSSTNTTNPTMDVAYLQGYYTNRQSDTASVNKFKIGATNETLTALWQAVNQSVKITPNSTTGNYKVTATNLFDKTDMIVTNTKIAQVTNTWGGASTIQADSTHFISGWIPVVAGATYKITGVTENGLVEWSENAKNARLYYNSTQATSYTNNTNFTIPTTYVLYSNNATTNVTYKYMRFHAKTSDMNNIKLEMVASSTYTNTQTLLFPNNASISIVATPNSGYSAAITKSSGLGTLTTSASGSVVTGNLANIAGAATTTNLAVTFTANTVTVNIYKDGEAWAASGMKVTLYNGTTATSYTATVSSGSVATLTAVPNGTYNIYIGKDSNHKTDMVDSGVDVTVSNNSPTATVNYYTLTMQTANGAATVNGTSVANNGTVILAGGTTTTANNYAHE